MPYVPDHKMQGGGSMALPAQNNAPTQSIQPTAGAAATAQGVQQAAGQEPQAPPQAAPQPQQAPPPPQPQPWRLSGNPFAPQLAQQIPTQPGANVVSRPLAKLADALQALRDEVRMPQHDVKRASLPADPGARAKIVLRAFGKSATDTAESTQLVDLAAGNRKGAGPLPAQGPVFGAIQSVSPDKLANVMKLFNMERSGTGQGTKKPKIMPKWYREGEEAFLAPEELYGRRSKPRNGLHSPLGAMSQKKAFELSPFVAAPAAAAGIGGLFGAANAGHGNRMRGAIRGAGGGVGAAVGGGLGLLGGLYGGAALEKTHPNLAALLVPAMGFAGGHLGMHAGSALAGKLAPEEEDSEQSLLYGGKYANTNNRLLKRADAATDEALRAFFEHQQARRVPPSLGATGHLGSWARGLTTFSGLGAGVGAALAPSGHRVEGAGRGAAIGLGAGGGTLSGLLGSVGLLGASMHPRVAGLLTRPRLGKALVGLLAAGTVASPIAGAVGGGMGVQHLLGKPSWKQAELEKDAFIPQMFGAALRGVGLLGRGAGTAMRAGSAVARGAGTAMQLPGKALNLAGRAGGAIGRGVNRAGTVVDDFGKKLMTRPGAAATAKAAQAAMNKAGDSGSRLRRMYSRRGESRGSNTKVRRLFTPHGESRRDPTRKLHRELAPHGEARMDEKLASTLDPFAKAFVDRCRALQLTQPQFELAVKRASAVHPAVAAALEPLTKEAIVGFLQHVPKLWGAARGAMNAGRLAYGAARVGNAGMQGAGRAAAVGNALGKGMHTVGQAVHRVGRAIPQGLNQTARGMFTGGMLGGGVDAVGDVTGMYDTGGMGAMIGAGLGGGFRSPWATRAIHQGTRAMAPLTHPTAARMAPFLQKGQQFFTGGFGSSGDKLRQFFTGGLVNPALANTRLGTAQKVLAGAGLGGVAITGVRNYARGQGTAAAEQAMHDYAQQAGFQDTNEMANFGQMMNSGDVMGMISHGWGKLSPQQKLMIGGGGALLGGGLLAGAMGHGGMGTVAGLGGAGLLGAGLLSGGNRSGLYGGAGGQQMPGGQQPQNAIDSVDPNMQPGSQQPGGQGMPTMEPRNELEMQMG